MRRKAHFGGIAARPLLVLAVLIVLGACGAGIAHGERSQKGNLIISLDGGLAPIALPRDRPAPVSIHVEGGLKTADGTLLPRVTRIALGLPGQGVLSTRGLPVCSQRRLRNTRSREALAVCGPALVGRGSLQAEVRIPNQEPFELDAKLLAFNGRAEGRRAVIVHAAASNPPTVAVLPFVIRSGRGRFGTVLAADLPAALGPWPRFAHFELTLSRRYSYRGRSRSYLSASCPLPRRLTFTLFSFARASFTLADGRRISTSIPRNCRAR